MTIYVITINKKLKLFKDFKKTDEIVLISYKDAKKEITKIPSGSLLYFDTDSLKPTDILKTLSLFMKRNDILYGILDSKNALIDIAAFFHAGGADYIGKSLLRKGVSAKRTSALFSFKTIEKLPAAQKKTGVLAQYKTSQNGWKDIKTGSEYTFIMMYIELDNQKELREFYSGNSMVTFRKNFHDMIDRKVQHVGGKIWMWNDFGGLILFPFNGKSCNTIEFSFRLFLDKVLYLVEEINVEQHLSFRIALHLGNTVYNPRGNTGTIISDSINSIHHLGQKYLKQGQFGMTGELEPFIPAWLKPYFVSNGEYEGRKIIRMKKLE